MTTRVQMTTEESSPGVPYWGPNAVITDLPEGQTEIALENLVTGTRYWVKTWNEDQFGNRSRELVTPVNTVQSFQRDRISLSAQGFLDTGSPMYAFVKVPASVVDTEEVLVTLAFRQFMAPAKDAATIGTQTSVGGGVVTSGASSASSSDNASVSLGLNPGGGTEVTGISGAASAGTAHTHTEGSYGIEGSNYVVSVGAHSHTIPHTHQGGTHTHDVAGHNHALTYGTFEESYPATHYVYVRVYKRESGAWVEKALYTGITADLYDLDLTSIIKTPGDWRIAVKGADGWVATMTRLNPVAWWRLGEPSGTNANDQTGNDLDLTYVNTPTLAATGLVSGDSDTAVSFNGTDERAGPQTSTLLQPAKVSFSAIVKPSVVDDATNFVGGMGLTTGFGFYIIMSNTQGFIFRIGDGANRTSPDSAVPVAGTTYHVVGTFDGATVRCYINGVEVGSGTAIATAIDYTGVTDFWLGSLQGQTGTAARHFPGVIDEAAVFNYALSATQVKDMYNAGIAQPNGGRLGCDLFGSAVLLS